MIIKTYRSSWFDILTKEDLFYDNFVKNTNKELIEVLQVVKMYDETENFIVEMINKKDLIPENKLR